MGTFDVHPILKILVIHPRFKRFQRFWWQSSRQWNQASPSLKIEKLSYPLLPWILPLSCQASMVEFKLNWGQHLRDLIAHAGPACTVVDKFGENHQVNNGKLVAIPTPDRFPLTVSVERAVLQASGGSEKLPLSDVTSDVPSPTSVATINTPSPKCQPINSFHRISKIL